MKRILLPAGGAVLATGLLAAGLAGTANAVPDWDYDTLAKDAPAALDVAEFWLATNGDANNLAKATAYTHETVAASKLSAGGGYTPDGKPGIVAPIGEEKKSSAKVKNINLPKTIGKVFFVDSEGKFKWCSATSIQSKYRNLVATAGHCVYDDKKNASVMDNWVFVPGYYQGKAPWGVYAGKTAYTHYDYSVYNDRDRDYAFVTVYNGVHVGAGKTTQVLKSEYTKFEGKKYIVEKTVTKDEFEAGVVKYGVNGPYQSKPLDPEVATVAKPADATYGNFKDYVLGKGPTAGVKVIGVPVTKAEFEAAKALKDDLGNGAPFNAASAPVSISEAEYKQLLVDKADGKFDGTLAEVKDPNDNKTVIGWTKQQYFVKKWVSVTIPTKYWVETYFIVEGFAKDAGRLGDNVGGQGFTWNQKPEQTVFVFGYPALPHPDGNKAYTGVTPKWTYGKTSGKVYVSAAEKVEEHIGLKSSFTPGADGGPWLAKYSNAKRLGYVNGVTSLFGDQDKNGRYDTITSPYFDGETAAIYTKASAVWSGKIVK
ncbi:hypothetical protein [Streptosporangium sp. H16]|uniref:hypothetical protein n=1 Tax=Streptosporangium sp. H16 TaxID=3444184 RepID=UPI003F799265